MRPTGWLASFFKRPPPTKLNHRLFGELVYSHHDGWINSAFQFWDVENIELQVAAGPEGPSALQEKSFQEFEQQRPVLLPRCLAEVNRVRSELVVAPSTFVIRGLSIPSLTQGPQSRLWTLWFDLVGDDQFMYGVQTDDAWATLTGFADD